MRDDGGVLRAAGPADLAGLLALEATFPGDRLSRRAFVHHLHNPRAFFPVKATPAGLAGYALALRRADSRWWRLYSLVRAEGAPRGTGGCLLEAVISAAGAAAAAGIRLEVREDNTSAIQLYRRRGFVLCGTLDHYYEDGARALRMALALRG